MSQIFLCAVRPVPLVNKETVLGVLRREVFEADSKECEMFLENIGQCDFVGDCHQAVYDELADAYSYLFDDPYDLGYLTVNGEDYWVSGGVTSGDDPTEAYSAIWKLEMWDHI